MKKLCCFLLLAVVATASAAAEDWSNVPIIDTQCSAKAKADPDSHARSCALSCAKSGFGIVDKDGNYLKFDSKGNQEALKQLQGSSKDDHLRVDVSGTKVGNEIHVRSLKLL
jgi:opacity protein-like surface antigen